MQPYLPVQCAPQLNLSAERSDVSLQRLGLRVYIHPLGLVMMLSGQIEFAKESDGYALARVLDDIERQTWLRTGCASLKSARNVVQLFRSVRNLVLRSVLTRRDPLLTTEGAERPFCVLGFGNNTWSRADDLRSDLAGQWELHSAVQRYTSQRYTPGQTGDSLVNRNRAFINAGKKSETGTESGWMFGSNDGVAVSIDSKKDELDHSGKALLCHSRNIPKLIGFYRLYHAYLEFYGSQSGSSGPRRTLEHALQSLDLMRAKYSTWWIAWASARMHLDDAPKTVAAKYGLERPFPPSQNTQKLLQRRAEDIIPVFISYTHDSQTHKDRVLRFANKLRDGGVDAMIDQYEPNPPSWINWMRQQMDQAKYVLVVFTETYKRRFTGNEEKDVGQGGIWEGAYVNQQLLEKQLKDERFLPVIFEQSDKSYIAFPLDRGNFYNVATEEGYETLYRVITDQPPVLKPELGVRRSLPPRSI